MPILRLEGISKSFGTTHALKSVELRVSEGEVHVVAKKTAGQVYPDGHSRRNLPA
ncbi:MAG: hypothetical protein OXI81_22040 [Paracoccaceae bacterium]|nr:hypothetical protein [Paracoccaceae bacterium]MDE2912504.1 hypothetical protein [Paracoccaceae bacterium]